MPDSLLLFILENTNKKVQNFCNPFADNADYFHKTKHCKLLGMVELRAFFGLLYLRASLKSNLFLATVVWYHESSKYLFAATMSMKHFQFISRFIEFDVRETHEERWKHLSFTSMLFSPQTQEVLDICPKT